LSFLHRFDPFHQQPHRLFRSAKQRSDAAKIFGEQKLMSTFDNVNPFFPAVRRTQEEKQRRRRKEIGKEDAGALLFF
jgi:hypothetical protein